MGVLVGVVVSFRVFAGKAALSSSIEYACTCRERVQTALAAALQAVQAVRDTYSSMVADVNISTDDLLAEFDGAPLEQYAERLDFYKQQINAVNNNTSTQV